MKRTVVLIILDGWGIGRNDASNPIHAVKPESFRMLEENFPTGSLQASGIGVGLPWGETGNSEVGHLTIGAGKVIYQYFPRITLGIQDKSFFENKALKDAFLHARKNNSGVNLVGLLTNANVHASIEHLQALLQMAEEQNVENVKLHLFADGKDSPPRSLEKFLKEIPIEKLSTLTGRYYAMDRTQNWQVTRRAYECMTDDRQPMTGDIEAEIKDNYARGISEEFLPPLRVGRDGTVKDNDALIFFNFREDSIRQLAEAFIEKKFGKFPVKTFQNLYIATMTRYEEKFSVPVAYPPEAVEEPLGKILSDAGKTQLRLAETYKYAHVTYFFNGYRESVFKNEYRVFIPSLTAPHPDEHPEMMASAITDRLVQAIESRSFDFILANYANPDTIGHTGNFEAAVETIKVIDKEIGRVLKAGLNSETIIVISSDHGNVEEMLNPETGRMETQHDPNPVPVYLVAPEFKGRKFVNWKNLSMEVTGVLSDIAPMILELMEIPQPKEMTGKSLLREFI
ncbi:MAG: 2,3-bisphosphoglycerate-independent phosphoglycerate mutase [Candidatus Liptonbacteria bacterium]|nr:2,3-bisphosphoglycerate-independent phosphoglycerate mutase [Candidatus Liptonbacteria bacterium]